MALARPAGAERGGKLVNGRHAPRRALGAALLVVALLSGPGGTPAEAKVFVTVDEALALAFPGCTIDRRTVFLTAAEVERAQKLAGGEASGALVRPYVAAREGVLVGTAYFDRHRVRTLSETIMIVVDPAGKVARVEVLAFDEPENYLPRGAWYAQFRGRGLDRDLALKHGIRALSGATLSARATTQAVRRVLAVHEVLATGPPRSGDPPFGIREKKTSP